MPRPPRTSALAPAAPPTTGQSGRGKENIGSAGNTVPVPGETQPEEDLGPRPDRWVKIRLRVCAGHIAPAFLHNPGGSGGGGGGGSGTGGAGGRVGGGAGGRGEDKVEGGG